MATAGPSRGADTWHPSRYLEPNHPDNEEVLEQAAYQAAITRLGGDDRRARRYKPRRTVDYMGSVVKWRQLAKLKGLPDCLPPIHPSPSDLIGLLPPAAHRLNPSTSICDHFVHTSINKERSPCRIVKWTPDARRLLTGNDKGQFTLWNGASFNYESITQVHDESIRNFAYSHNGQALISADKLGMIKYFTPHLTNIHGFQGHREACHGISWSPNDERFVTGGDDGLVKIWRYREAKEERVLSGHGWDVRSVDWHPTKGLIASGSKDMLVKFWDPRTGKELSTLHSHKAVINTVSWNPNGHIIATAGGDGMVRLFDIRTYRELEAMKGHTKEVNCIEWHPIHHNILATGDAAGAIFHWSLLAPDPSKPLTVLEAAHEDSVNTLAFHPLGHILCSGSKDFTARFWCRARPTGGQENDRWHLGEEKAHGAKMESEMERPVKRPRMDEELGGLPGLWRFAETATGYETRTSPIFAPKGSTSLPGLGGYMEDGTPVPVPLPGWAGNGPMARTQQPLPSQDEIARAVGAKEERRKWGPAGGNDARGGGGHHNGGGGHGGQRYESGGSGAQGGGGAKGWR